MDYRYSIINECLGIVRQSNMPVNNMLYLEALLYRVKLSLLKSANNKRTAEPSGDFKELISQAHAACDSDFDEQTVRDLAGSIHVVISQFNTEPTMSHKGYAG
ncbi:hypothetical protein [Citrifermentans bremense]|uniref:hypothetical protein n=1 Tax=Citrifermentans bremense TaxID=60035 RepID=UPI00047C9954|nr:hypothetical protein [Citrifermentans bremense]